MLTEDARLYLMAKLAVQAGNQEEYDPAEVVRMCNKKGMKGMSPQTVVDFSRLLIEAYERLQRDIEDLKFESEVPMMLPEW